MTPSKIIQRYVANSPTDVGDFIANSQIGLTYTGPARTYNVIPVISYAGLTRRRVWIIEVCES